MGGRGVEGEGGEGERCQVIAMFFFQVKAFSLKYSVFTLNIQYVCKMGAFHKQACFHRNNTKQDLFLQKESKRIDTMQAQYLKCK